MYLIDLANKSFESSTGRVFVRFGHFQFNYVRVNFGFGSSEVQVCVIIRLTMFAPGSVRVKFGFVSLTGTMFGLVQVRFGWSSSRVCFGLSTVTRFESSISQL